MELFPGIRLFFWPNVYGYVYVYVYAYVYAYVYVYCWGIILYAALIIYNLFYTRGVILVVDGSLMFEILLAYGDLGIISLALL